MAHWIIEDKGFGGVVYRCSNCRESWNDYYSKFPKDYCRCCGEDIDEDANEYIEELKKTRIIGKWEGIPVVKKVEAEWIMVIDDFEDGKGNREYPHCTNCNKGVYRYDAGNWCPFCGASIKNPMRY